MHSTWYCYITSSGSLSDLVKDEADPGRHLGQALIALHTCISGVHGRRRTYNKD